MAILAEQGLERKRESNRITYSISTYFPVRRLAQKHNWIIKIGNFFLILTGGWLTNTFINLIRASADGNIELLNQLKRLSQELKCWCGYTFSTKYRV